MEKIMKQRIICVIVLFVIGSNFLFAAEPELSGVTDTTINYTAGTGDAPENSLGIEEYANLRLRFRVGEKAIFYSAFNLTALAGNYLENTALLGGIYQNPYFASTPFIYGQNYAAGMELERLYFRINGDYIDAEAGLLRINFGYGQVWGSSDFLNPRNPLFPNARPRGVLGVNASFYPVDSLKLLGFIVAPKNPLVSDGGGEIHGLSMDQHWDRASLQALYAYQNPDSAFGKGVHRFGLSLKADIELGFVADGLYTLNPEKAEGIDGLSLGAGFDYSFLDGDLYVLAEYLFNGSSSVTALGFGGNWSNNHYLYGTALYRFNDHTNLGFSTVFCFDDLSFSPFATLNYELFQGFSLSLTARLPMDQKTLNGGKAGELGPVGAKFIVNAGARLRF
jgi:hypothetical protein